jgi:hypothetical protein
MFWPEFWCGILNFAEPSAPTSTHRRIIRNLPTATHQTKKAGGCHYRQTGRGITQVTVKVTVTVCGLLLAPLAVIVTVPL